MVWVQELFDKFLQLAPDFFGTLIVSVGCGLLIGLERESRGKPAGARTLVLICLGSAIFVQISMLLAGEYGDPARVAAQIVTGIGFLGAGAIIHQSERGYITGLTTAATIWVGSAVGMLVGGGYYFFAVVSSLSVVGALRALRSLEKKLFVTRHVEARRIYFDPRHGKTEWRLIGFLEEHLVQPTDYRFFTGSGQSRPYLEIMFRSNNRNHRSFLADVAHLDEVTEIAILPNGSASQV